MYEAELQALTYADVCGEEAAASSCMYEAELQAIWLDHAC
jgi:hypothetical protein